MKKKKIINEIIEQFNLTNRKYKATNRFIKKKLNVATES